MSQYSNGKQNAVQAFVGSMVLLSASSKDLGVLASRRCCAVAFAVLVVGGLGFAGDVGRLQAS